jgi:hypothetical protein
LLGFSSFIIVLLKVVFGLRFLLPSGVHRNTCIQIFFPRTFKIFSFIPSVWPDICPASLSDDIRYIVLMSLLIVYFSIWSLSNWCLWFSWGICCEFITKVLCCNPEKYPIVIKFHPEKFSKTLFRLYSANNVWVLI